MHENMKICTGNMMTEQPQDLVHQHNCSLQHSSQHFIHSQKSYILSLVAELNNLAVSLHNEAAYAIASEMLKDALQIFAHISLPYLDNNSHLFENRDVDDLMHKIVNGKEILKKYDSRLKQLAEMDLYFMPSSKCDRSAFLSEPARILLHPSENQEKTMRNAVLPFHSTWVLLV